MAVAFVQEFKVDPRDRSTTNYDAVAGRLGEDAGPIDGLIAHTAGFADDDGVFRIFDVWESREQAQRFIDERLMPIVEELGQGREDFRPPELEYFYELHDVVTG